MKHARLLLLALTAAAATACAPADAGDAALPPAVQASIVSAVEEGGRVGVVVGYIRDGEASFFAHGEMAAGSGRPVGPETIFETGSVTKLFTAETLAALTLDGAVSLDTGLAEIWPERLAGTPIVLAQLATHTAGLPRQIPDDALAGNDEAALLAAVDAAGEAGGEAAYSNTGMAILARALAVRTGETPAANVHRLVAAPMGLADTGFEPVDADRLAHPHLGRTDIADTRPATVSIARGAGGLYSSPRDLLRLVEQHLAPQSGEIASLVELVLEGADGHPLGWQVHDDGTHRIFHHSGDANGYQAFVGFRRDTATGVVLLANSSAEDGLQQIALHLLDSTVPLPVFAAAGEAAAPEALDRYAGAYVVEGDDSGNRITILATSDGLIYVETGPDGAPVRRAPLVEREPGLFQIRGAPIRLDFETGEAGMVRLTAGDAEFRLLRQD